MQTATKMGYHVDGVEMNSTSSGSGIYSEGSVEVFRSPRGGRGIVACADIINGICIGRAYSWVLTPLDIDHIDRTSIEGFWFNHPITPGWGLFPVGVIALVNHSVNPNAKIDWNESDFGYLGRLVTISQIAKGEEILIDYGIQLPEGWIP